MGNGRRLLLSCLVLTTLVSTTRADPNPRLKATWNEKDANIEAFSPDRRTLVSSGSDGHRLRDAQTGKALADLATKPQRLYGTVFSGDGRYLYAKVNSDRYKPVNVFDLKVWDAATGQVRAAVPYISEGINVATDDFAVSADGKTLAFLDHSDRLPMEVETGKMGIGSARYYEFTVHYNRSKGLPRVIIWEVPGWHQKARVDGGSPLVLSSDGARLITGARDSHDPTARIWDTATGRKLAEFNSGGLWMKPLVFSPDEKFLAIGTWGKQELYEVASGRRWPVAAAGNAFDAPVFSKDGRLLFPNGLPHMETSVLKSQPFCFYNLANLPPSRLELESGKKALSPDGRRYATVKGKRFARELLTVVLRELPSLRETGQLTMSGLDGAEFTPDGRWLALLTGRYDTIPAAVISIHTQEMQFVDPATARVTGMIPTRGPLWGNCNWKFSHDGKTVALSYVPENGAAQDEEPNPRERPVTVELWEIEPR